MCLNNVYRAVDKEIAEYEALGLNVGLVVPCPFCGLVMIDMGTETEHTVMCPECGIIG